MNQGGSIKNKRVNPDLQAERDKIAFDRDEMSNFFFGEDLERIAGKFATDIEKYPELKTDFSWFDMTREEKMAVWFKRYSKVAEIDFEKYFPAG